MSDKTSTSIGLDSVIRVEKVSLKGPGVLILTGPSSSGKGQVANAICRLLSVDPKYHLSMGEILRKTIAATRVGSISGVVLDEINEHFKTAISSQTDHELREKVLHHLPAMTMYFRETMDLNKVTGALWLEYCTNNGLLIPNRWTELLLESHINKLLLADPLTAIILDGYPRTVEAARRMIDYFKKVKLPILKVIHLSISRDEMIRRASLRGRDDDSMEAIYRRFDFYVENVHPSIDFLKEVLGSDKVALVDAHQPVYFTNEAGEKVMDVESSITRICISSLRALGVPRIVISDLLSKDSFCP